MAQFLDRYPVAFPVFFLGLWLTVTTLLGVLSGWYGLMQRYPDRDEDALITLGGQSGMMGLWVSMRGILKLSACPSGLRVGMLRVFGPFSRPFFVPWGEIDASEASFFFATMVKLRFERSDLGALWLYRGTWERLLAAAPTAALVGPPLRVFTDGELVKRLVLQWAASTGLAGAFFYFAPRLTPPRGPGLPLAVCIGFPALVFGAGQIFRFLTQRAGR